MISSLPTNMHIHWLRQEILANDLANASTAGFKRDGLSVAGQPVPPAEPTFAMLGMTPNDHYTVTQWTDYSPGPIRDTGRSLDVAIDGPGFFVVQTPRGLRYTRAGGLTVDRAGLLTTAAGYPLMGGGGPIAVRSTGLSFSATGEIYDDGQILDTHPRRRLPAALSAAEARRWPLRARRPRRSSPPPRWTTGSSAERSRAPTSTRCAPWSR